MRLLIFLDQIKWAFERPFFDQTFSDITSKIWKISGSLFSKVKNASVSCWLSWSRFWAGHKNQIAFDIKVCIPCYYHEVWHWTALSYIDSWIFLQTKPFNSLVLKNFAFSLSYRRGLHLYFVTRMFKSNLYLQYNSTKQGNLLNQPKGWNTRSI